MTVDIAAPSILHRAPALDTPARTAAGCPPRLVVPGVEDPGWGLADERARGHLGGPVDPEKLLAELERSGLRGRGGAGFPAHRKWRSVASADGPAVVVANGHEGEPASGKDTWLLTRRPHLVLDGLLLAAQVTGADEAIVYVSRPAAATAVERAIDALHVAGLIPASLTLRIHRAEHRYVAGEESAVCRAINSGIAKPTDKPPRPFESGVRGRPTLVSNVETLAHAAWIRVHGGEAFAAAGNGASTGTALFTVSGAVAEPGVYEMELGRPLADLFDAAGGPTGTSAGMLMGGWFNGILPGDHSALACCYDAMRAAGTGLGCGAVTVLGPDDDLVETAGALAAWYGEESALQCGICINGTRAIARTFRRIERGDEDPAHRTRLATWGATTPGRGACGLVDGAFALARTAAEELERRAAGASSHATSRKAS